MRRILHSITPPARWRIPVILTLGVLFGFGLLIFRVSNASSYLSDNPNACINCHVMTTQFASWQRSSHARVATCNDCHVPHHNFVATYAFKASDGLRHSAMFTFRLEPQVIQIKEAGANVVQENCLRCHGDRVHQTYLTRSISLTEREDGVGKFCWDCHREIPHGTVRSLSAYPYARVPQLEPVIPDWIDNLKSIKK